MRIEVYVGLVLIVVILGLLPSLILIFLYSIGVVSIDLVVGVLPLLWAISCGLCFVVYRSQKRPVRYGPEVLVGRTGRAVTRIDTEGLVSIEGVLWRAISTSGFIEEGSDVVVVGVSGTTLLVKRRE